MDKETIKLILGYDVGDELHDEWRKSHPSKDENNILDKEFKDLSKELQNENLQAGITAINLVFDNIMNEEELNKEQIEELSSKVHEAWMIRNSKELTDQNNIQSKSYQELPEEEKVKDRKHILKAIEKVKDYKNGKVNLEEQKQKYNI